MNLLKFVNFWILQDFLYIVKNVDWIPLNFYNLFKKSNHNWIPQDISIPKISIKIFSNLNWIHPFISYITFVNFKNQTVKDKIDELLKFYVFQKVKFTNYSLFLLFSFILWRNSCFSHRWHVDILYVFWSDFKQKSHFIY